MCYGVELLSKFADDPNAEYHRHLIEIERTWNKIRWKKIGIAKSRLPRVCPPSDLILRFGELDITLPDNIWVGLFWLAQCNHIIWLAQ